MWTLVVKGGEEAALDAAEIQNLRADFIRHDARWNHSVLSCDAPNDVRLARWFRANDGKPPFAEGTLLAYYPRS